MSHLNRVVILIDMDCFYCQVEEKLDPKLAGEPIAVVQYNAWRGGGIIAVNYPARDKGVTRHMRGNDAKAKCPNIKLVSVPEVRGKADLTKYRDAGKDVADVLQTFTSLLERASVDEAYLDITDLVNNKIAQGLDDLMCENMQNTFVVGSSTDNFLDAVKMNMEFSESNLKLAVGGLITEDIRRAVYEKTGYKCSAGIAHNKILAKLVCGLHKPNKQTILPHASVADFFEITPVSKIKSLGGKFGQSLAEDLGITYIGQLTQFSKKELMEKFDAKNAVWLYDIARGIDMDPVTTKLISKSIGCCKKFPGRTALTTPEKVEHWLSELCCEMHERLEKDLEENNRKAKQMVLSFVQDVNGKEVHSSKTHPVHSYEKQKIFQAAYNILQRMCMRSDRSYAIKYLGLSAGHFEVNKNVRDIASFFKAAGDSCSKKSLEENCSRNFGEFSGSKLADKNKSNNNSETNCVGNKDDSGCHEDDSDTSTSTQDLHENPNDLIFYDEKYLAKKSESPKNKQTNSKAPKTSFFNKYFCRKEPLEEVSTITHKKLTGIGICEECGENVPLVDLVTHKDYHFAVKLTQADSAAVTASVPNKIVPSVKKVSSVKKPTKRKHAGNFNFLQYFKTDTEATETCPDCNRKLRIDELEAHGDYHLAKKLHLELNPPQSLVKPSAKQEKNKD